MIPISVNLRQIVLDVQALREDRGREPQERDLDDADLDRLLRRIEGNARCAYSGIISAKDHAHQASIALHMTGIELPEKLPTPTAA